MVGGLPLLPARRKLDDPPDLWRPEPPPAGHPHRTCRRPRPAGGPPPRRRPGTKLP